MSYVKSLISMIIFPVALTITACDVVKLDDNGKPIIPISAEEAASIKNMEPAAIANKIWDDVIKDAQEKALDPTSALEKEGKSTFVKFKGKVSALEVKKHTSSLIITADDGQVIELQVGDIIRGNAIRDAASFIEFDQFKNQVQFAHLSKELNKKALNGIEQPTEAWSGREIDGLAAVTINKNKMTLAVPLTLSTR